MASTLPPNLLSYIGTFVEKEDRPHCALVCKHWKEPFLDAYWGKLYINRRDMDIITLDSNKSLLINVHRVWAVTLYKINWNDYKIFLELQQFFPGIRCIELHDIIAQYSLFMTNALDWSLWKSLTHINIKLHYDSKTSFWQSLFMKLSTLPFLVHLTVDQSHFLDERPPFSWNDFEFLHYHLPRLEYLKHDFRFKPITRDDIESIRAVEPAQTMTRIEFNKDGNPLWLFYFASKYPNLQHFIFNRYIDPSNRNKIYYNPQQYQPDLQLLSTLDQFFPCLKKAVTVLRDKSIYLPFIFYETLRHFGTKIEHVKLIYESPIENDNANKCIRPISESLKFLEIDLDTRETIRFPVFPRLVTLYIFGQTERTITADEILECFPALHSLTVNNINLSLSTNPHTYTLHPLQKLEIRDSDITNAALHYLSLRCNQLKHVKLANIGYNSVTKYYHYTNGDSAKPGQFIFDMSMSKLDTFILTFSGGLLHYFQSLPKHHMIEQMENDNPILQTTQQPPQLNWYHICCDRTNRKPNFLKRELGRRDIEFCQRYFKDFYRRRKRGKERKDTKDDSLGYMQKRFWKKDLQHGVLVFRFKSVKNHIFRLKKEVYNSIR